jgi:hypothetical protein
MLHPTDGPQIFFDELLDPEGTDLLLGFFRRTPR